MTKFQFIPVLAITVAVSLTAVVHAQNPPMNCAPDGIVEVCTLADTTSAQTAVAPVVPPAPPAPHVTYKDGQLTITAENVPLSEVLHEVSRKTGATLEVPSGTATEPVFVNIGPGSVRDVLVKLLNGTQFNYVMLGSQDTSSDLKKIVLTPAGQSAEVDSSPVVAESVAPQPTMAPAGVSETREQRRAEFMAKFESARAALMQRAQEKYAEHVAQGDLRTPDPNASAAPVSPATSPSTAAPPSPSPAATDSPAPDAPAPDSANQ